MKHLLLTLILLTSFFASGQIVNIPDANFKNALLNHNPVIDTNGDGEIQYSEAEAATEISVPGQDINNLSGIESFVGITKLNCSYNNLTTIDISSNTALDQLIGYYNFLTTLDVSQNSALQYLFVQGNQITNIELTTLVNLVELSISSNQIGEINLNNNINLLALNIGSNPIQSIDLSQNTSLWLLRIGNTGISNLDFSFVPNLTELDISYTPFQTLDFSILPDLQTLFIRGLSWTTINLNDNQLLRSLYFDQTQLDSLDLSNNPNICRLQGDNNLFLEYINLKNGNNEIFGGSCSNPTLSLLNNPNLQFICVEDAQYAASNFTNIPPLTTFVEDCSIANGGLNHITGTVKYDDENNGCDGGDAGVGGLLVNTTDGTNNFATTTINTGDYNLTVAENTYTTTVLGLSPYFTLNPAQAVDNFVGFNQTEIADFCIAPTTTANDLAVTLVPLNAARPGFEASYKLVYENVGTTQLSGNVELDFDGMLVTFVEATPTETSINGNTISWDYSNLNPFETRSIEVVFEVAQPPIVESGDVLPYIARVNPVSGDAAPDDNVFQLNQIAVNSFDPNDKQVLEGYQVLIDDADEYLHYVVRFQNMGTANAINVRVQDALDEKLDWTTLKVLDASHAMETQLVNGSIDFIFDNINLPTASSDPEGSQGFVAFKVKPVSTVQLNDVVANAADIYFDFNAAIVTNTVFTKFVDVLGVTDFDTLNVVAYPNPANNILNIQADGSISSIEIMNVLGQTLLTSKGNSNREQIDISGLSAGNYFVKVVVGDGSRVLRVVKK